MKDKTTAAVKITRDNMAHFAGQTVRVRCQVGVVLDIKGVLHVGYGLCWYGIKIKDENGAEDMIGFSYGEWHLDESGQVVVGVY